MISIGLGLAAQAAVPDACRNAAAYDSYMQGNTAHAKACADITGSIDAEFTRMKTAAQKAKRAPRARIDGSQADALTNVAADAGDRSVTEGDWSKIAGASRAKFDGMADAAGKHVKQIDQENAKLSPALSGEQRTTFLRLSAAARKDMTGVQANAVNHASAAGKLSTQFQGTAEDLQKYRDVNNGAAQRLNGQDGSGQQQTQQPIAVKTSSKNVLLGVGGGLLIAGAAVGGLYWVSQKAIKSTDAAATARIAQAQAAANNVIANAGATATAVITAAQTAAQNIIQFATNSANQIISNAAAAANAIYDKAKADITALKTELTNEISAQYQYLTTTGLTKLQTELGTMFSGLIARAQTEGNAALASSLQSTLASLQAQIQTEVTRRGTSTGTGAATSSGTSTSVSTDTSTGTVSATSTAVSTGTSASTATATSTTITTSSSVTTIHRL